jgi:ParB family chromosome partitioning protein
VIDQLAAFGISPPQITKRLKTRRADVDAAITISRSDLAKAATARYDWLTLDHAATVAEFEGQPDTVTALIAVAKTGQFDHVAQRARDDRAEATAGAALVAELAAVG